MASSSVSQDDIDNDFEKNSRRSRIRTARARAHLRLESAGERSGVTCSNIVGATVGDNVPSLESVSIDRSAGDSLHELAESVSTVIGISSTTTESIDATDGRLVGHFHPGNVTGPSGDIGLLSGKGMSLLQLRSLGSNTLERESGGSQRNACIADRVNSTDRTGPQSVFLPSGVSGSISGIPEGHETSPKPGVMRTGKDKCSVRNKLHHVNKGKPQRDRRKLREKRRSSGVVHLASTESTGGSTTGDDEGSSDACIAHMEDRHVPNQHQQYPVSCSVSSSSYSGPISSNFTSYHMATNSTTTAGDIRKKIHDSNMSLLYPHKETANQGEGVLSHITSSFGHKATSMCNSPYVDLANNGVSSSSATRCTEGTASNSSFYDSVAKVSKSRDRAATVGLPSTNNPNISLRGASNCRRDKSPSDLEADDENDHDSLNQSETGSGSNVSVCNVGLPTSGNITVSNFGQCTSSSFPHTSGIQNQASPNYRNFLEPTLGDTPLNSRDDISNFTEVVEENKRLLSLMDEKDRRIHLLEYKVQQLMRDTLTISEEQSRLQKENSTLLRALSKLTMSKEKPQS